jgi:hypothetical protein
MAVIMTRSIYLPGSAADHLRVRPQTRNRRISRETGWALDVLGHAIDYLATDLVDHNPSYSADNEQLGAVQLLIALKRQVYLECPEAPSLAERFRSLLGRHPART